MGPVESSIKDWEQLSLYLRTNDYPRIRESLPAGVFDVSGGRIQRSESERQKRSHATPLESNHRAVLIYVGKDASQEGPLLRFHPLVLRARFDKKRAPYGL